jgi:hypothetical protein
MTVTNLKTLVLLGSRAICAQTGLGNGSNMAMEQTPAALSFQRRTSPRFTKPDYRIRPHWLADRLDREARADRAGRLESGQHVLASWSPVRPPASAATTGRGQGAFPASLRGRGA